MNDTSEATKLDTLPPEAVVAPAPKPKKQNPPAVICIINKSTAPGLAAKLSAIVAALSKQLARDVSLVQRVPTLVIGENPGNAAPFLLTDELDVDGALGYHDEAGGLARGFVGTKLTLDNGGTLCSGANSISQTMSHEIIEMGGDYAANLWADAPDGSDYARERCDAPEGDSYDIDGIAVSNFLTDAFFDGQADATEKLDFMGLVKRPFETRPAGYQIKRSEPGRVSQVFGAGLVYIVGHRHGRAIHAAFGRDFPTWKIPGKVARLRARIAGKVAA